MSDHIPALLSGSSLSFFRGSLTHECPQSLRPGVVTQSPQRCCWNFTATLSAVWFLGAGPERRFVHRCF